MTWHCFNGVLPIWHLIYQVMLEASEWFFRFLVVVPWDHQFRPNPETRSLFVSLASEKIRRFFGPKKGKKSSRNNRWAIDLSGATPPKTNGYPLKIAGWFRWKFFLKWSLFRWHPFIFRSLALLLLASWRVIIHLGPAGLGFDSFWPMKILVPTGSFRRQWWQVHLVLLMVQKSCELTSW